MKSRLLSLAAAVIVFQLLFITAMPVFAGFSPAEWKYFKPVLIPSLTSGQGLVELLPDKDIYASAQSDLADLRIIDVEKNEIPYKLEICRGETSKSSVPLSIVDNGYVPGKFNTFIVDLGKQVQVHNQVLILLSSINFRRQANVESSSDKLTWMQIASQTIYDFTAKEKGFSTKDTTIKYPDSSARYLRITIIDDGNGPLEVINANIFKTNEKSSREAQLTASMSSPITDSANKQTVVDIDLGSAGLPSYRMKINVSDINFNRFVSLSGSTDKKSWSGIHKMALFSYDTEKIAANNLDFTFPEAKFRYLQLTVNNGDNPALNIQSIAVWGIQRRLVFNAETDKQYYLYYGNVEAKQPVYDIDKVFPYLVTENLPMAGSGQQQVNISYQTPVENRPATEQFPWLISAVVLVAAGIIGVLIVALIKQAKKVLPPPEE